MSVPSRFLLHAGLYQVVVLPPDDQFVMPSVDLEQFISVTYEPQAIVLVCPQSFKISSAISRVSDGWRILQIKGPFSTEGNAQLLNSADDCLKAHNIQVMVSPNYETDFLLFKEVDKEKALAALHESGFEIDTNGRSVAI